MLEYLSFILQCKTVILLGATSYYIYSFIKMAELIINELLLEVSHDPPESDVKRQKLIECVLTGNSKLYLGKDYTKEQVSKLNSEEVDKLFNIYEAKLSRQMVVSGQISYRDVFNACAVLGITNQDEDLDLTHLRT